MGERNGTECIKFLNEENKIKSICAEYGKTGGRKKVKRIHRSSHDMELFRGLRK